MGSVTADGAEGEITFVGIYDGMTGMQIFASGGEINGTVNFTVDPGAGLQMASEETVIEGDGMFLLANGSTLGITSADGITLEGDISGNVQTMARVYDIGANYIYNGTSAQVTGDGLTFNIPDNLTIDNAFGTGNAQHRCQYHR